MSDYIHYLRNLVGKEKVIMVAAGVLILDQENRVLLQLRSDNGKWGRPGGFMEMGETIEETARREVYEETGLTLGKLDFFGIYSGPNYESILANGDQVALVKIIFTCQDYHGTLDKENEESLELEFFSVDNLPENIYPPQKIEFIDLLSGKEPPFIK